MDSNYGEVATDQQISETVKSLEANNIKTQVVDSVEAAKEATLKLIPKGSEVFTVTSVTLDQSGIAEVVNGPEYVSVRNKMMELYGQPEKKQEMKRLTGAPVYVLGSAHALTQDGKIMIASATGSQISPEAYGAEQVIYVIGAQKIVKDLENGLKRIKEYSVPLEDKRALKAYGSHTSFNKLLVINKELPDRMTVIIIKEKIGF